MDDTVAVEIIQIGSKLLIGIVLRRCILYNKSR